MGAPAANADADVSGITGTFACMRGRWGVGLLLFLLTAGACGADRGSSANDEPGRGAITTAPPTSASARPVVARTDKTVTNAPEGFPVIELVCCQYSPAEVTVSGASVRLFLLNLQTEADINDVAQAADLQHDLTIVGADGLTLAKSDRLAFGERATFTVEGLPPGSYEFYCTLRGHSAQGMRGSLKVQA